MADYSDAPITPGEVLVDQWLGRLELAREAKSAFSAIAEACNAFYRESAKFMWEDKFRKKFLGDIQRPKFEVTINAAFEFVAIFGPYLFWEYPSRTVKPYEPLKIDMQLFGGDDPGAQQFVEAIIQEQDANHRIARQRSAVMERYLNYSQREQQDGLAHHSMCAIHDALVKGRGVLVPRLEQRPGSDRVLTGLHWESVDNLFIDPDCTDALLNTATWVAIRHQSAVYEVEDRFDLPRGTLMEAGSLESSESFIMNNRAIDEIHRANGGTNDIIIWYEIWSKCGVAGRTQDSQSAFVKHADEVVGDFAYLCVAPGVPWLLNAPPAAFNDDMDDDEVRELLGWPFPCYQDARWPVVLLDFYPDTNSPWPIAPLSAGLGHLICINVLMSAYVEQAYENRKQLIAILEAHAKDFEDALSKNTSPVIVKLKGELNQKVHDAVQYMNRPNMNTDILGAIEMELRLFAKATGLVEFMYGDQQTQDRSARTTAAKEEKTAIRPEKMAKDVAAWQSRAAQIEALLAALEVQGSDVEPHIPAVLWDMLISRQDPERVMREMDVVVEATDIRRPNRERDLANLQVMAQQAMAAYMQGAAINGDVEPINAYMEQLFKAMEQPFPEEMRMQPWVPQPPSPELQEQMQMQAEAEQQKTQAELQKLSMELEGKKLDAQMKQLTFEFKSVEGAQRLQQEAARSELGLMAERQRGTQSLQIDAAKAVQELQQSDASHGQDMLHSEEEHELALQHTAEIGQQKVRLMRSQAAETRK